MSIVGPAVALSRSMRAMDSPPGRPRYSRVRPCVRWNPSISPFRRPGKPGPVTTTRPSCFAAALTRSHAAASGPRAGAPADGAAVAEVPLAGATAADVPTVGAGAPGAPLVGAAGGAGLHAAANKHATIASTRMRAPAMVPLR